MTPKEMLEHLRGQCTVGTLDIDKLESMLNNPWEAEGHIIECLSKMTLKRQKLQTAGINRSDEQMAIKIVKQMFMCRHFDEVDLTTWERKPAAQKTLVNAKTFFSKKHKEKLAYQKVTARQLGYAHQAKDMPKVEAVL